MRPDVDIVGVELPGRGPHIAEPPVTVHQELLDLLLPEIGAAMDGVPTVFFGHSMGALLAYRTAVGLRERQRMPQSLVLSSCAPPHRRDSSRLSALDDKDLVQWIRELDGTPAEVLASPEALAMILPILRADLRLLEDYPAEPVIVLPCPILGVGGVEDRSVAIRELQEWECYTSAGFRVESIPGGHFYFQGRESLLCEILSRVL